MPSPRIRQTMGSSGTCRAPPCKLTRDPVDGGVSFSYFGAVMNGTPRQKIATGELAAILTACLRGTRVAARYNDAVVCRRPRVMVHTFNPEAQRSCIEA